MKERIDGRLEPASPARLLAEGAEPVNRTEKVTAELRLPRYLRLGLRGSKLLVEIPHSIVSIRDRSLKSANTWTLHARTIFENYFRRGYAVTDVAIDDDEIRVFYILEPHPRI